MRLRRAASQTIFTVDTGRRPARVALPTLTPTIAYDRADLRRWLRWERIGVRIARKGIESSERLGRRRRVIERTMSWLSGYRRLSPRYERHPRNYLAFQLDQISNRKLTERITELTEANRELERELTQLRPLAGVVQELERDLAAARTSLRQMIRNGGQHKPTGSVGLGD